MNGRSLSGRAEDLREEAHRARRVGQRAEAGGLERGEEEADRDPDRLAHVVVLELLPVLGPPRLLEDDDHVGRVGDVRLHPVGADRPDRLLPFGCRAAVVEVALLGLGALAEPALRSGSETTTNVQGCWCAPDGAVPATRIAFSTSSQGTGSSRSGGSNVAPASARGTRASARVRRSPAGARTEAEPAGTRSRVAADLPVRHGHAGEGHEDERADADEVGTAAVRRAGAAELQEREGRQGAADESADVAAPRDVRGSAKVSTRLMTISDIAWPASEPVSRYSMMNSAPKTPQIAPDAPTVTWVGFTRSAPAAPARPETR